MSGAKPKPPAFTQQQGLRPYQEDRFLVAEGIKVAPKAARSFLSKIFGKASRKTDTFNEGSTATALILSQNLQLDAAFLGDSPVVLFIHDPKTGAVTAEKLTRDHHAWMPSEKRGIERRGGWVAPNGRADGRLALSRALGDAEIAGISQTPEFTQRDLKTYLDAGKDVYLCLSSDGLFEGLTPEDYLAPFAAALKNGQADKLAEIFTDHALQNGSQDNVTACVVKVSTQMTQNLFLAIADCHGGDKTSIAVIDTFRQQLKF